ncbi:MAG: cytochrome [Caulobacteraceae bacterium]|nr:cytochrome [Caulobacteraceae bacterium]
MHRTLIASLALLMLAGCVSLARAETPDVAYGHRLAQSTCGACHAVGAGASALEDAPPFRDLYKRYGPGGLEALLTEGMLAPDPLPEEGSIPRHPRMPSFTFDVEQRKALIAFLHSLEPVPRASAPVSGQVAARQ